MMDKSKQKKMVPAIRFSGFTDDWEQRKLGDFADRYDNLREPITAGKRVNGNVPYYGANGIQDYVEGYTHDGDYLLVAEDGANDLVDYPVRRVHGKVWVNNHAHVISGKSNKADNGFLAESFKTVNIKPFLVGGGRAKLNSDVMMKLEFRLPDYREQRKIGVMMDKVDNLLTLHQRKLAQLEQCKTLLLQNLFPKNGTTKPSLRFAVFTNDWEQRKLVDVSKVIMGQSPHSENYTNNPDDHILVQGNADVKNGRVVPRVWTTEITKSAPKNSIILGVRAPVGTVGITDFDVVIGRGVAAVSGNAFVYQTLLRFKKIGYWTRYSTGSTFESISSDNIKNAIVNIPSIDEQNKVGAVLSRLDNIITLHQRKLRKLKVVNRLLHQKMFV
ncbi:restriction endonuclease subunit S [Fructobacillus sp. M158]|uniref:restriction endonuclease subunit S n=1 Tax=Fructobacillus parabroussonetiae TaxID=2713174 RepID=UPI00200B512D|nr:restriction endonuclease subunit S [Fructobacillus parabroussonetiae]MCK8617734.1 restriction endonuclease subunit S [Fructobacillus parabroussonetiae]